jgi:hypothetical protein
MRSGSYRLFSSGATIPTASAVSTEERGSRREARRDDRRLPLPRAVLDARRSSTSAADRRAARQRPTRVRVPKGEPRPSVAQPESRERRRRGSAATSEARSAPLEIAPSRAAVLGGGRRAPTDREERRMGGQACRKARITTPRNKELVTRCEESCTHRGRSRARSTSGRFGWATIAPVAMRKRDDQHRSGEDAERGTLLRRAARIDPNVATGADGSLHATARRPAPHSASTICAASAPVALAESLFPTNWTPSIENEAP